MGCWKRSEAMGKILIDLSAPLTALFQRRHMKSALIGAAWNDDGWTFDAMEAHCKTLVRYLNLRDMGMVLAAGHRP